MSPEAIASLLAAGPWVAVLFLALGIWREINSGRWIHSRHHHSEIRIYQSIIERQDRLIDGHQHISRGSLDIADQVTHPAQHQSGREHD